MVQKGRFNHQPGFPFHWQMRGFGSGRRIRSLTSLSELVVFWMKRGVSEGWGRVRRYTRNGSKGVFCLLRVRLPVEEVRFLGFARNDKSGAATFLRICCRYRNSRSLHCAPHAGRSGRDDKSFELTASLMNKQFISAFTCISKSYARNDKSGVGYFPGNLLSVQRTAGPSTARPMRGASVGMTISFYRSLLRRSHWLLGSPARSLSRTPIR